MGMFHEGSGMTVMERLTHKAKYEAGYKLNKGIKEWQAVDRLAGYENTGLTSEQILEMDRLYTEKCREVAELRQRDTPVKVKPIGINHSIGRRVGVCPKCDVIVNDYEDRFCRECGCRLEWGSWEEWEETCKH